MLKVLTFILILNLPFLFQADSFRKAQKRYPRVRQAYKEKEQLVKEMLSGKSIKMNAVQVCLRAFKKEKEIEVWAKNSSDTIFQLLKTYDVCATCGLPGPKRKQGDMQIPEGYYHIDRFNAYSVFYLSLGINYPNTSDRILGKKGRLGGDIFIHGECVTIGCLPITTPKIKELYVLCVEAKNAGQKKIPVTIFLAKLSQSKFHNLKNRYKDDSDRVGLWTDLKAGYDFFNKHKKLPGISFLATRRHRVSR